MDISASSSSHSNTASSSNSQITRDFNNDQSALAPASTTTTITNNPSQRTNLFSAATLRPPSLTAPGFAVLRPENNSATSNPRSASYVAPVSINRSETVAGPSVATNPSSRTAPFQLPLKSGPSVAQNSSSLKRKYDPSNSVQNVELNMRAMDSLYDTNFIQWIKNHQNVDYIIMRLRPVIAEFDVSTVANGIKWIMSDWPLDKKERLFESLTLRWDLKTKLSLWREINNDFWSSTDHHHHHHQPVASRHRQGGSVHQPVCRQQQHAEDHDVQPNSRRRLNVFGTSVDTVRPESVANHSYNLRSSSRRQVVAAVDANANRAETSRNVSSQPIPSAASIDQRTNHSMVSSIVRQRVISNYLNSQRAELMIQQQQQQQQSQHSNIVNQRRVWIAPRVSSIGSGIGISGISWAPLSNNRRQPLSSTESNPAETLISQQRTSIQQPICCQYHARMRLEEMNRQHYHQQQQQQMQQSQQNYSFHSHNSQGRSIAIARSETNSPFIATTRTASPVGILMRSPSLNDISPNSSNIEISSVSAASSPSSRGNAGVIQQDRQHHQSNDSLNTQHSILKHSASSMEFSPLLGSGNLIFTAEELSEIGASSSSNCGQNSSGSSCPATGSSSSARALQMSSTANQPSLANLPAASDRSPVTEVSSSNTTASSRSAPTSGGNENESSPLQLVGFCQGLRPSF